MRWRALNRRRRLLAWRILRSSKISLPHYRILAQQGVLDGFGHVSVRHNRADNRFIMSRSLAPELVTASDLIEFDLDGNAVNAQDDRSTRNGSFTQKSIELDRM
jgi:hypothetical protein